MVLVTDQIALPRELRNLIIQYRRTVLMQGAQRQWLVTWKSVIRPVNAEYHRTYKWGGHSSFTVTGVGLCHVASRIPYNWRTTQNLESKGRFWIQRVKYRPGDYYSIRCHLSKITSEAYIYSMTRKELHQLSLG